jgi:thioredoxin 1
MINNPEEFNLILKRNKAVLIYLSGESCNICKVLRPSVERLLTENFSEMVFLYVDVNKFPEIAAQQSVFTIPTVICIFEGREFFRKSRTFGVSELAGKIERPYNLLFKQK